MFATVSWYLVFLQGNINFIGDLIIIHPAYGGISETKETSQQQAKPYINGINEDKHKDRKCSGILISKIIPYHNCMRPEVVTYYGLHNLLWTGLRFYDNLFALLDFRPGLHKLRY